jgi:hypothetical protein
MLTVYKYHCLHSDMFNIEMPIGAKVLTVQYQKEKPVMWALVNPDEVNKIMRSFLWIYTGEPVAFEFDELVYVGTIQSLGGNLVYHLFEVVS